MAQARESTSAVDRVFIVLEACARSGRTVSLTDLVAATGMAKTTAHRLCWKLTSLGALEHVDGGFRIGPRLFALGALNPTLLRLRTASMPLLYEMSRETGHISNLAIMENDRALLIDEVFAAERSVPRMVGASMPLHATALGKVLLAGQPLERRTTLVGPELLHPFTRHTIVRPNLLLEQLVVIARSGIAYSREEWRLGVAGVAASVLDGGRPVAALALVGIPRAVEVERYGQTVRAAADALAVAIKRPVIRDAAGWAGEWAPELL
jgi:DNA-binding IclR family transcriptional regulator